MRYRRLVSAILMVYAGLVHASEDVDEPIYSGHLPTNVGGAILLSQTRVPCRIKQLTQPGERWFNAGMLTTSGELLGACWMQQGAKIVVAVRMPPGTYDPFSYGAVPISDLKKIGPAPRSARWLYENFFPWGGKMQNDSARPSEQGQLAWCSLPLSKLPHESVVCDDQDLSRNDFELAVLSRRHLQKAGKEMATKERHGSFEAMKACGPDRSCLLRQQEVRRAALEAALQ